MFIVFFYLKCQAGFKNLLHQVPIPCSVNQFIFLINKVSQWHAWKRIIITIWGFTVFDFKIWAHCCPSFSLQIFLHCNDLQMQNKWEKCFFSVLIYFQTFQEMSTGIQINYRAPGIVESVKYTVKWKWYNSWKYT